MFASSLLTGSMKRTSAHDPTGNVPGISIEKDLGTISFSFFNQLSRQSNSSSLVNKEDSIHKGADSSTSTETNNSRHFLQGMISAFQQQESS